MDPVTALGAAGSVVGIIGFGLQLSQILYNYLSQVWSAQERLEAVVDEIELTTSALQEIYVFLQLEVANIGHGQPLHLFSGNSLEKIRAIANRCLVIFWRVEATISGNLTAELDDRLLEKLLDFDNKLKYYTPGSTIQIESELTLDPLGLRDRFRWPSRASKLDKYCKQLQRYQDSLVLLLQIVSLGQQRLKPNPTEEDIRLMLKTYAIIHEVATPEELRIIAFDTQTQNHNRRENTRREASVSPSYIKPRILYRATARHPRTPGFPTKLESYNLGSIRYRNPLQSRLVGMGTQRPKGPRSDVPLSPNKGTVNSRNNISDVYTIDQPHSLPSTSQAEIPPVRLANSDDITQHDHISSMIDDANSIKESLTQAQANSVIPNGHRAHNDQETMHAQNSVRVEECSKLSNAITKKAQKVPDDLSRGPISSTDEAKTGDVEVGPLSPSPLQDSSQTKFQTMTQQQSRQTFEKSGPGSFLMAEDITEKDTSSTEVQILPYVLYEGGAYQLPVSLGLDLKSKLRRSLGSGHPGEDLTEKLAFMSTSQVQTLQNILRYKPGDQARKLAHLEVIKKRNMKFWQKSKKVIIAFVEGEMSSMPEGVSLVVAEPIGSKDADLKNTAFSLSWQKILPPSFSSQSNIDAKKEQSDTEHSSMGRAETTRNAIAHIQSVAPKLVSPLDQLNDSSISGISGIQDVTSLLIMDEEWRKSFIEHYKVWTIRPFLGIDEAQSPSGVWNRCAISEKYLNIPEIKRRLTALDKSSMTILAKMTMLTVSQQLQVQQSFEVVKSGASGSEYQWKLRQLDIVRSRNLFRQKYVKKVVVYACVEPCSQAFNQSEELQKKSSEIEEGPLNVLCNNAVPSFVERQISSIQDKTDGKNKRPRNMTSTDKEDIVSTDNSEFNEENNRREESSEMERLRRHRRPRVLRRREIERANEAIASRPPIPSETRGQPQPTFPRQSPTDTETRPAKRLPPQPTPPIIINNRIYNSYSTDESDSSGSDTYKVRDKHSNTITGTRRVPTRGRVNYHRRSAYYDDDNRRALDVHESDTELREKTYPLRREIQAQRKRDPRTSNRSTDRNSNLQLRRSDLSWESHSTGPRQRSRSAATIQSRPRLLKYYTDEELRANARARQRYPDEFDKQPYNPQISPEEEAAGQEAIEQLLLEWTPLYKAEHDDNHGEDPDEPTEHEVSQGSLNEQSHLTSAVAKEPEVLQYVIRSKDANHPPAEKEVDIQLEKLPENQAGETPVAEPTRRDKIEWTNRIAVSQPPFSRPQRRETTDGISLVKPVNRQPLKVCNLQTLGGNDDDDIEPRLLQKGNRAATVPILARQTWEDINWARQIVEETATLADPEENEPPLQTPSQNPITAQVMVREFSPRGGRRLERELLRDEWWRDNERHRSPTLRSEARERSRIDYGYEGSFERRPNPPPRRRTVEFEGPTNRHMTSPGHRKSIITVERRDSVSEPPQERQQFRTQVRYRSPHIETWVENDDYRSGSRERSDSSRR
ncbi:hypothetical protein F4679DRAFT_276368 [Xylaria curta]|nr:hypothetical protein F4679DRAFT_276368 [Xylaria curta]